MMRKRKGLGWTVVAGALLVVAPLLACKEESSGSGSSSDSTETEPEGAKKGDKAEKKKEAPAKLGETVKFKDSEWVVVSAENAGKEMKHRFMGKEKTAGDDA